MPLFLFKWTVEADLRLLAESIAEQENVSIRPLEGVLKVLRL
jgi:hypothetical protein